jgi:hypothetical protein
MGVPSGIRRTSNPLTEAPQGDLARHAPAFERDGFLVIDPGIATETLDGVIADLAGEYRPEKLGRIRKLPPFRRYSYRDDMRIQDAWRVSRNVREVALAPRVLGLLEALYQRRPLPFQTLNFRVGTQQAAHSDTLHFNSQPAAFMCGVWVALEDIDADNGPLVYYPGSHKLPEVMMQDIGAGTGEEEYPKYEAYIEDMIVREGLQPQYAHIEKGQALLWAANLLHGGAPQNDPSRTRLSQVTHYFFEGCRYWTPMLSDDRQTHWRKPRWIR